MPDGDVQDPMQALLDRIDAMQEEMNALQRRLADSPTYGEVSTLLAEAVPSELTAPEPPAIGEPDTDPVLRLNVGTGGGASYWDANYLPEGSATGDMLVWNHTTGKWQVLTAPADDYRVLAAKASETLKVKWDWPRINTGV